MDTDQVWRTIDQQRSELADLMETFTDSDWRTPSLCKGWRVRDVAAHLTLAQMDPLAAVVAMFRARGSFDQMIHDTAVRRAALPVEDYPVLLRAMAGTRKKAPVVTVLEPMIDLLVHGQDMTAALGRERAMPPTAAAAAAQRVWSMSFPFHPRKHLSGLTLDATDHPWRVGGGPVVEAPIQALLMLVTGRTCVLAELGGPGGDTLRERLTSAKAAPL